MVVLVTSWRAQIPDTHLLLRHPQNILFTRGTVKKNRIKESIRRRVTLTWHIATKTLLEIMTNSIAHVWPKYHHKVMSNNRLLGGMEVTKATVFAAARLLELRVRNPSGTRMAVSCDCCTLSGRGLCDCQRSHTDCGVSLCMIQKHQEPGGPGLRWAVVPKKKMELRKFSVRRAVVAWHLNFFNFN